MGDNGLIKDNIQKRKHLKKIKIANWLPGQGQDKVNIKKVEGLTETGMVTAKVIASPIINSDKEENIDSGTEETGILGELSSQYESELVELKLKEATLQEEKSGTDKQLKLKDQRLQEVGNLETIITQISRKRKSDPKVMYKTKAVVDTD